MVGFVRVAPRNLFDIDALFEMRCLFNKPLFLVSMLNFQGVMRCRIAVVCLLLRLRHCPCLIKWHVHLMWSRNMLLLEIIDLSWNYNQENLVIEELELQMFLAHPCKGAWSQHVLFFWGAGGRESYAIQNCYALNFFWWPIYSWLWRWFGCDTQTFHFVLLKKMFHDIFCLWFQIPSKGPVTGIQ